jgi:hypothetical protein
MIKSQSQKDEKAEFSSPKPGKIIGKTVATEIALIICTTAPQKTLIIALAQPKFPSINSLILFDWRTINRRQSTQIMLFLPTINIRKNCTKKRKKEKKLFIIRLDFFVNSLCVCFFLSSCFFQAAFKSKYIYISTLCLISFHTFFSNLTNSKLTILFSIFVFHYCYTYIRFLLTALFLFSLLPFLKLKT